MHKSEIEATGRKKDTFKKRTLEEIIGVETGGPQGRRLNDPGHTPQMYAMFADFIRAMLIYQPSQRTTAAESLKHPYLYAFDTQPDEKQEDSKQPEDTKTTGTSESSEESTKQSVEMKESKPLPTTQSSNQSPPKRR